MENEGLGLATLELEYESFPEASLGGSLDILVLFQDRVV